MLPRISTAAIYCFLTACSAQVDDLGFPASSYVSYSGVSTGDLIPREQLRRADLRYLAVSGLTPDDVFHVFLKIGDKTHSDKLRATHSRSQSALFDFIRFDEKGVSTWRATDVFNRLIRDSDPLPVLIKTSGSGGTVRFYQATPPPGFIKPV